jgi:hypothetical protein
MSGIWPSPLPPAAIYLVNDCAAADDGGVGGDARAAALISNRMVQMLSHVDGMVHLAWLAAALAAAAAAASSGSVSAGIASLFCLVVACNWHHDGVCWKIKTINAIATLIWPLSGLSTGRLNRRVFEALSLYTMTKQSPARACDGMGVMRRDVLVPRLSGIHVGSRIKIRLYQHKLKQEQNQPLLVYFHGGGFTVSHVDSADYDRLCADLALRGFSVASVEYRLAPEHVFPAAIVDAYDALLWCAGTRGQAPHAASTKGHRSGSSGGDIRIDGSHGIILAGDSAGGNLSAVMSQLLRDNKNALLSPYTPPPHLRPKIAAQLLIYPSVDRLNKLESRTGFSMRYSSLVLQRMH